MDYLQLSPFTTAKSHWLLGIIDDCSAQCPWLIAEHWCSIWQWLWAISVLEMATPRKAASWSGKGTVNSLSSAGQVTFIFVKWGGWTKSMAWKIKVKISRVPFIRHILFRSCVDKTARVALTVVSARLGDAVLSPSPLPPPERTMKDCGAHGLRVAGWGDL